MNSEGDAAADMPSEVLRRRKERLQRVLDSKTTSKADLVLDDFIGKRLGRGNQFYGKRLSDMDEKVVQESMKDAEPSEKERFFSQLDMKPNAILVVGATGRTGKWVTINLQTKGFNVRLYSRNLAKAERMYGPDGISLDIVVGDVRDREGFIEAAVGCQASVFCAGSRNIIGGDSFQQVDGQGVVNWVEACQKSGTVQKLVLVSSIGVTQKQQLGPLNKFVGDPLGAKIKGEKAVRDSGLPYVIVRPGGLREEAGGLRSVEVGQGDTFTRCGVSRMDVAEAVVEALVSDAEYVTFEMKNGDGTGRKRTSYLEPDADRRKQLELQEQMVVEDFWTQEFSKLNTD